VVTSRRGKTGGWKLIEPPADISLLRIVEALEPEALGQIPEPIGESGVAVKNLWESVQESSRQILAENTLETLAAEDEPMFYI
jgi:DNA-binding IscR family transcriptional regulator